MRFLTYDLCSQCMIQSSTPSPFRILIVSHEGAPILKSKDLPLAIRKEEHSVRQISNLDFRSYVIFLINFLSKLAESAHGYFLFRTADCLFWLEAEY